MNQEIFVTSRTPFTAALLLLAVLCGPAATAAVSGDQAVKPDNGAAAAAGGQPGGTDVSRNMGKTPPMGWNSYNRFGLGVSAELVREIADGVKKHQLDEAGYKYLVIDDGWQGHHLGPGGELLCAQDKFPDGIAPLVKHVKGLGLELGIYSSPNRLSCGGRPGSLDLEEVHGILSPAENRAHFSLWCVLNAPLILGNDLRQIPADTLEVIRNKEVIALNQDLLCKQAEKVLDSGDVEVFSKPLANGDLGVCVLNRGGSPAKVTVTWDPLGLPAGSRVKARDLWAHQEIGEFSGQLVTSVPSHDVIVYRLSKP